MTHKHDFVTAWECQHTGHYTGDVSSVNYNVTYTPIHHYTECSFGRVVHVCRVCGASGDGLPPAWRRFLSKLVKP